MSDKPSEILSREVVDEWAARGQRSKRFKDRADELRGHLEIGAPIKDELIALAKPLIDCISKNGLAGVSIPMQDIAEAKDIHIDFYPLYEEIQCVLDRWGSIYIEVDTSTSRQKLADSHEALRARVKELEADRDKWRTTAEGAHVVTNAAARERDEAIRVMDDATRQNAAQVDHLNAALTEASRQLAEKESEYVAVLSDRNTLMIDYQNRGLEIAELRVKLEAETKRLNWLERLGFSTNRNNRGSGPKDDPGIFCWIEGHVKSWTACWIRSDFKTMRAAIDAAIAGEKP